MLVAVLGWSLLLAESADARPIIRFDVSRAGDTKSNFDHFHQTVDATLTDPRGWSLNGAVGFDHTSRNERFVVQLTEPSIVGSYAGCSSYYSCRVGRLVMINDNRWRYGTRSFADKPRHLYRQMVINHEVGHALGFDHRSCGGLGQRAPVMQQQSKGLAGCVANAWPVSSERRSLAQRWGVAIGPTPPGLDVGDRIGPITMGATRGAVFGRLGQPSSKVRRGDSYVYAFALEPIAVELTNRRVTAVSTRSGRFRTSRGLGVGSTRSDLRQSFTSHELLRDGLHPQGG